MPATLPATSAPDIAPILHLIRRTRTLLRSSWGIIGLGRTAGLALAVLLVVASIDMVVPLVGPWVRLTGLILFGVLSAIVFLRGVVFPLLRRLSQTELARRIEARIPGMHSRLVSCVDLARRNDATASAAFYRRLVNESMTRIAGYKPSSVLDFVALRRAVIYALVGGCLFAGFWFGLGKPFRTALVRVFHPYADIPPVTDVSFTVQPGSVKILENEPILIAVQVAKNEPESFTLELYSSEGEPQVIRHPLVNDAKGHWMKQLEGIGGEPGFAKRFTYRIFGGGTWSPLYEVVWLERPRIELVEAKVHFAHYLAIPEPRILTTRTSDTNGPDITGPEESEAELLVHTSGQVSSALVELLETRTRQVSPRTDIKERQWFEQTIPAGAKENGTWNWEPNSKFRAKVFTEPARPGTHAQGFEGATDSFPVHKGEVLFADVLVDPQQVPETIMLTWITDKGDMEHRAYWGANKIEHGTNGTASRMPLGPIPKSWIGQWTRVEVPASLVGLEGSQLKGMYFTLLGGKCSWHRPGASKPSKQTIEESYSVGKYPLQLVGLNLWSGRFPLKGAGKYHIEIQNEAGYTNTVVGNDARYEGVKDEPPKVRIEHPTRNLALSKSQVVQIVGTASDDNGLAEITLSAQRENTFKFIPWQVIRTYAPESQPVTEENFVHPFDLTEKGLNLKPGDSIRYRLEVKDRRLGKRAVTSEEHIITIGDGPNTADKQQEAFEKSQDPFRDRLLKLIGDQEKVKTKIDQLAAKYETLNETIKAAQADVELRPKRNPMGIVDPKDPANQPLNRLDPKVQKELDALKKELGELFGQENPNVAQAQNLSNELDAMRKQAEQLQLLDPTVLEELKNLQKQFNELALDPLKDLANQMQRGSTPQQTPPDLKAMQQKGNRLQQELQALKHRADVMAQAEKNLKNNRAEALKKWEEDRLRQKGDLSARELAELKDFLKQFREEMERLQGRQMELEDQGERASEADLPKIEKDQLQFDEMLKKTKENLQALLDEVRKRRERDPMLPDDPFAADPKERKVPPREQDSPEAKDPKKDPANPNNTDPMNEKPKDEGEPLFKPALSGEKVKQDPRFANKQRDPKKEPDTDSAKQRRENLQDKQNQNQRDIDAAKKALASDENALEKMIQQLMQKSGQMKSAQGKPMSGQEDSQQAGQDLKELLQSAMMQRAMQMAGRAKQQAKSQQSGQPTASQPMPGATQPNLSGTPPSADGRAQLDKLDPELRKAILQLPPNIRDEMLNRKRRETPEAFEKFVLEYLQRLAELQQQK